MCPETPFNYRDGKKVWTLFFYLGFLSNNVVYIFFKILLDSNSITFKKKLPNNANFRVREGLWPTGVYGGLLDMIEG